MASSSSKEGSVMRKKETDRIPDDPIQKAVLNAFEVALDAQLRAIRRLKAPEVDEKKHERKSRSQVDLVYDILIKAGKPLHISEILDRIEKTFGQRLDRESVVSSLTKKVQRQDRFVRTDRNVFALRQEA
jgi:hypothetical protein